MNIHELAVKYSTALFNLAASQDVQTERLKNLEGLAQVMQRPHIALFFASPQIRSSQKEQLLKKVLQNSIDPQLLSFLLHLVQKGRFIYFLQIFEEYRRLVRHSTGAIHVKLVTAIPLEPSVAEAVRAKMEKLFQKRVEMDEECDIRLIGGGILSHGNKVLDFSLKSKLARLKEKLMENLMAN